MPEAFRWVGRGEGQPPNNAPFKLLGLCVLCLQIPLSMHAESFCFLPKAFQLAFQGNKWILSARGKLRLLSARAIQCWGSGHEILGTCNRESSEHPCRLFKPNPPLAEYLDIWLIFFFFFGLSYPWVRWAELHFDDVTWTANDPGKCLYSFSLHVRTQHTFLWSINIKCVLSKFQPVFIIK